MKARALFDKICDGHVVTAELGCPSVLYIDLHLIHEVPTVRNVSIQTGARAGMIAPDDTILEYLRGKTFAPGCGVCIAMSGDELAAFG